jgi:hypothetical protein
MNNKQFSFLLFFKRNKQGRHVEINFSVNDHVHENYKEFQSYDIHRNIR